MHVQWTVDWEPGGTVDAPCRVVFWRSKCLIHQCSTSADVAAHEFRCFPGCRQQDDELDQLGQHVERLGGLGREIHGELESQSRMLDELDEEVETTHHR